MENKGDISIYQNGDNHVSPAPVGTKNKKIELPVLGQIELENTDWADWKYKYEYDSFGYNFENQPTDLDVHFINVTDENIEKVAKALNDLKKLNEIGINTYQQDFEEGGEAKSYVEEWTSDIFEQIFSEEEFAEFIAGTDKNKPMEERILSLLRLVRCEIYSESNDSFVTLDYAFGYDMNKGFRDYMLIVKMNENYEITEIVMEG